MRLIPIILSFFWTAVTYAQARSIFEDKYGNGVSFEQLRTGNIRITEIPGVIIAVTNNLLSYAGYVSLGVILMGSLMYVLGGVNEEAKAKGKEAIKVALAGAIIAWSGWVMVNFVLDNLG